MPANPPYYDDVRWPGAGGLRVPQESAPATLSIEKMVTLNGNGASTITLNSGQVGASELVITNMGSITSVVSYPAAFPGRVVLIKNSTGSGSSATIKVTGQTGFSLADGSHVIATFNTVDLVQWAAAF